MESIDKKVVSVTVATNPTPNLSQLSEVLNNSENSNPNLKTPVLELTKKLDSVSLTERKFVVAKVDSDSCLSESIEKKADLVIPATNSPPNLSQLSEVLNNSENLDPNLKNPVLEVSKKLDLVSPITERKFVVAKVNSKNCLTEAYKNLRSSQEEFLNENEEAFDLKIEGEIGGIDDNPGEKKRFSEGGSLNIKRRREEWLEEARRAAPEPGSGFVMYLVEAFEKLSTMQKEEVELKKGGKGMKWALPGMQENKENELQVSMDSVCPSDFSVTSESLGLNSHALSPSDNNGSVLSRISGSGRKNRKNSSESTGTFAGANRSKKSLKAKPFKLRTEQREKNKQEQLAKKLQQDMVEEVKQLTPVALPLPWTTDTPESLVKPPVRESTKPIDLVLHSDVRATERAEFDKQVAEKMSYIEQYKRQKKKLEKLAEEAEIRRLRKELVPKAQPMPFFDRPFIPKRSLKLPTIPREPKFHLPERKRIKSCLAWNETSCAQMR